MPKIKKQMAQDTRTESNNPVSPQSQARAEVASYVWSLFADKRDERDRNQELFRDRSLKEYIDDNVKRFIQFKQRPAHKKKWQSNLASTTPYEKLIGILSKIATRGMEARVVSRKDMNAAEQVKERIINSLGKAASIKNNDNFQIILEMLEAGEKGTVIGFEDWYHGKRQIREILDQNPETGEVKFKAKTIKEWNDVRGSLVNLEDFYPGNLYVRPGCIQDMDDCFLRTVMTEDEFDAEFGKYTDADLVKTNVKAYVNESTPFWRQSDDVANDEIEVLRYFNKRTDEYVIIANEIWINPIGKDTVSPLPWNHKQLPFWGAVYAPFDASFFYGRSLIDLLIADTDAKDGLFDRIMDQMTLAVSRPIVTDGEAQSVLTKGFLQPNNVITTDWSSGRPNFEVVPIPDPPAAGFSLLQMLENRLERASVSAEVLGGAGKQKTATQASIEREGAIELVSLFLSLIEEGAKQKYSLRFANILQFYSLPTHSEDEEERFKKVIIRNERLTNGRNGVLQIDIRPDFNQSRVEELNKSTPGETEFIEITPDAIRNFVFDVEVVPQSSIKMTEQQRQILELNYQRLMFELYGDKFDRDYGFEELNKVFNKDTEDAKAKQPIGPIQPGQIGGGMPSAPETNIPGAGGLPPVRKMPALGELTTI